MADWLSNRRAIVTGAARGIGLAVSQSLAMNGAQVLMVDNGAAIDGSAEDPAVLELASARVPGSVAMLADIGAPGVGRSIVEHAVEHLGGVDVIVHAAGVLAPRAGATSTRESFEQVAKVDILGPMDLFDAAVPVMQQQIHDGRVPGAIVTLSAAEAFYGDPEMLAESVGKAASFALTRSLAHRLLPTGIGVNAVIPMAGTRQVAETLGFGPEREDHHKLVRPLSTLQVAHVVAWLCTPLAAGISGQLVMVRGREVILFSQARPTASFFQPQLFEPEEMAQAMASVRRDLTDDWTAIDAFGNDPVP